MDIPCRMIFPFHDAVYVKMGNKWSKKIFLGNKTWWQIFYIRRTRIRHWIPNNILQIAIPVSLVLIQTLLFSPISRPFFISFNFLHARNFLVLFCFISLSLDVLNCHRTELLTLLLFLHTFAHVHFYVKAHRKITFWQNRYINGIRNIFRITAVLRKEVAISTSLCQIAKGIEIVYRNYFDRARIDRILHEI